MLAEAASAKSAKGKAQSSWTVRITWIPVESLWSQEKENTFSRVRVGVKGSGGRS